MGRAVCQRCLRPEAVCSCALIRPVHNRTGVIILQHPAERRHPLGTVRMAQLGLHNVEHHVHWDVGRGKALQLQLPPGTALLYPGEEAADLRTLSPAERPSHLLVLDGTWSQARVLVGHNPWLAALPKVSVVVSRPSRYEDVRPEPSAECVSTVEAIVEAIGVLEPELEGLDGMLTSLEQMVARQQSFAATPRPRFKRKARRPAKPISELLHQTPERVVVAYCETLALRDASGVVGEQIVVIGARRLRGDAAPLVCYIRPQGPLPTAAHLRAMGISPDDLETGISIKEAATRLLAYLGDDGVLAAWNQRILNRLRPHLGEHKTLMLKGMYCNLRLGGCGQLEDVVEAEGLPMPNVEGIARGERRLRCAVVVANFLQRVGAEREAQLEAGERLSANVPTGSHTP